MGSIGIESLVCQQGVGLHLGQKRVGTFQVVGLPGRQEEGQPRASTMAWIFVLNR